MKIDHSGARAGCLGPAKTELFNDSSINSYEIRPWPSFEQELIACKSLMKKPEVPDPVMV